MKRATKKSPKTPPEVYGIVPEAIPHGIRKDPRYCVIRETTVWKCQTCRRVTYLEGRVTEKGCRVCDKAVTQDMTDPFASHPTPHGDKR